MIKILVNSKITTVPYKVRSVQGVYVILTLFFYNGNTRQAMDSATFNQSIVK